MENPVVLIFYTFYIHALGSLGLKLLNDIHFKLIFKL